MMMASPFQLCGIGSELGILEVRARAWSGGNRIRYETAHFAPCLNGLTPFVWVEARPRPAGAALRLVGRHGNMPSEIPSPTDGS